MTRRTLIVLCVVMLVALAMPAAALGAETGFTFGRWQKAFEVFRTLATVSLLALGAWAIVSSAGRFLHGIAAGQHPSAKATLLVPFVVAAVLISTALALNYGIEVLIAVHNFIVEIFADVPKGKVL